MSQTPDPNKTPGTPAPKWNPYYRRNPDGTPGGHDKTVKENADRAEAARRPAPGSSAPGRDRSTPAGQNTPGQPVRRPRPVGQSEPIGDRRAAPSKQVPAGGTRYRRQENGTLTRVYPHRAGWGNSRRTRLLLIAAAALIVVVALVIGIVALAVKLTEKIDYTYHYGDLKEVASGEAAMPDNVPYLNMHYLAAVYSMTISGSYEDMKFSTSAGEYASFVPGSRVTMVNGNRHVMSAPAVLRGEYMWIPSDFVESVFEGITVVWDNETHTVTVTPAKDESGKSTLPLTFKLRPADVVGSEDWSEGYHYLTDMTAFRDAIEPANRDAYLILVNKEHALPDSYVPTGLVEVTNMLSGRETQKMCEVAELALQGLYQDMIAAGFTDVGVSSGYRPYKMQEFLFGKYVDEEMKQNGLSRAKAEEAANRYSARPGQSEHQSGLAVDMYNTASATEEFAATAAYAWLKDNAHQYGFIIRYPADKTVQTGYNFEPWHFRFVGRYHATQMHEQGLCLEEYLAKLG